MRVCPAFLTRLRGWQAGHPVVNLLKPTFTARVFMATRDTYILIDYENVQPKDFRSLAKVERLKFKVFVGATQKTLPVDFVVQLNALSEDVEYIQMEKSGKNALDFHVAFHVGRLFELDPQAIFRIISNDKGFDPLIHHMNQLGAKVSRSRQLAREKPEPVVFSPGEPEERVSGETVDLVVENLRKFGESRPKSVSRLARAIGSWLQKPGDSEIVLIMEALQYRKVVSISEQRVSYALNQ